MARLTQKEWDLAYLDWISTGLSNTDLAKKYGVDEKAIRRKGAIWGPRNAASIKRAKVAAAQAGTISSKGSPSKSPNVRDSDILQEEADRDIATMSKAARVADAALDRCEVLLALEPDARDTKAIVDATRAALETYRKARNLDEPAHPPKEESSLDRLALTLAQARRDRL